MQRRVHKRPHSRMLHIGRLVPNMLTLLGLCAGLTGVRYALAERWEMAVAMVLVAAFIDGIDGRLARLLKSTSPFGAQLDSLCDMINFGIVPPMLIFLWQTHTVKGMGWGALLFFAICCALRLARFNTQLDTTGKNEKADRFFQGTPAPAAATLCLLPLALFLWNHDNTQFKLLSEILQTPVSLCIYQFILGLLMISRIPTFSAKKIAFNPALSSFILLGVGVIFILFISDPWLVIVILALGYLVSIPISVTVYMRTEKASGRGAAKKPV